jgi:hypothetical protein
MIFLEENLIENKILYLVYRMAFCHSCGVEIDEKDRYCHSCGAELGQYTGVDVQSSNEVRDNDPVNPTPNSSSEQHPEKDEVKRMVAESPGTSLTQELLLDTGEVGFASPAYLNEAPLVKYLDEDETVQYLLWNNTKGVRFESQSDITPSEDYRTMVAVTDHRLLIVVGCEEENKEHSIPYDTILEIDLSTSASNLTVQDNGDISAPGSGVAVALAEDDDDSDSTYTLGTGSSVDVDLAVSAGTSDFTDLTFTISADA